jgi:hypothetical protein
MGAIVLLLLAFTGGRFAQAQTVFGYDAADQIDLLPTPRSIELTGEEIALAGWQLVVPVGKEWATVAASEINSRIQELGGRPLPVVHEPSGDRPAVFVGRWRDPHIRSVSMQLDVTLTPGDPGEQGYVIARGEYDNRPVILLGGSDDIGALYAAVTFRRMLQEDQGQVVALRAGVRDWPDFKRRNNGRLDLDRLRETDATVTDLDPLYEAAEALKEEIDFFFRHKVNYLYTGFFFRSSDTDDQLSSYQRELAREIVDYAQARGIELRLVGGVEIGAYLTSKQREKAVTRSPGTSYMWAAFPAHRANGDRYARYLGESIEQGIFSLHLDDQGGYIDPERWSLRSDASREMYGDDKNQATLEQFQLYFEPAREAAPGIGLEIIPYPYHFQFGTPDFPGWYQDLLDDPALAGMVRPIRDQAHARTLQDSLIVYHRGLARDIPDDVFVVFREANRAAFEACSRLYEDHPITIWIYPDRNGGWHGTFAPQVRMARTFWRPGAGDLYFVASSFSRYGDARVQRLAQQEYLWKVDRPDGSAAFSQRQRGYEAGGDVTGFQRNHLIPRISRILYGEWAPTFAELSAANLSFAYVSEPEEVAVTGYESENFDRVMEHMAEQASGFDEIHRRFESVYQSYNAGNQPARLTPWAAYYYKYTGLGAVKARLHAAEDRVRRLLEEGDHDRAEDQLTVILAAFDDMHSTVERLRKIEVPGGRDVQDLDSFGLRRFEETFESLRQRMQAAGEGSSAPTASVQIEGVDRTTRTVTYGYSTIISYRIRLSDDVDADGREVSVEVYDRQGNSIATRTMNAAKLSNAWLGLIPDRIDLGLPYYGDLTLTVDLVESQTGDRRELGVFKMDEDAVVDRGGG